MGLILLGAAWVALGILGSAASPTAEAPWLVLPRDAARLAVEDYNHRSPTPPSVFRLFKLRSTHKTRLEWGIHFSLHFTIKETHCQKTAGYRIGDCRYKPNGLIQDCSAEVSFLNLMWDSPVTSMKCGQAKWKKTKPHASPPQAMGFPPQVNVEHYIPASYSVAALTVTEEE
ncbi:cathelicidin-2-like [Python bivittatus]|uniref:Vipericidin n=1 Tax=Python bivittatus TaxID=176946 RepID=A0A2R3YZX3_PYTBI|nr:cathelicidin-2-like [Python bivittatus]AVR43562.1 CATH5 [Python bivittatus]